MGVTFLLDTHVFLWLLAEPDRIDAQVLTTLAARDNTLLVSAASAMEVATKVYIGKLTAPGLPESWTSRVIDMGAIELDVTSRHATLAGSLAWQHRDPFDRLLAAQAILENATLVTVDRNLLTLPGLRSLTW